MRLWHEDLLPTLPQKQLQSQHRECCALRGNGWGMKHSVIDYIFDYNLERLCAYHWRVMDEHNRRGYSPGIEWRDAKYRGKIVGIDNSVSQLRAIEIYNSGVKVYSEHNDKYKEICVHNLLSKGFTWLENESMNKLKKFEWIPLTDNDVECDSYGVYNGKLLHRDDLKNFIIPSSNENGLYGAATAIKLYSPIETVAINYYKRFLGFVNCGEYVLIFYTGDLVSCVSTSDFTELMDSYYFVMKE
jgi:uncharacterized protein (TIGR02328 family)